MSFRLAVSSLLNPERMLGDLPHQLFAGAGEIAQLLDGDWGHEATADETMGQEVGDPSGVVDVALAAGDVADMHGVGEDESELEGALSGGRPVAAVRGARGAPGPTSLRAVRTNAKPTSGPTRAASLAHFMRRGSATPVGN